jgi:hypothetical protein
VDKGLEEEQVAEELVGFKMVLVLILVKQILALEVAVTPLEAQARLQGLEALV